MPSASAQSAGAWVPPAIWSFDLRSVVRRLGRNAPAGLEMEFRRMAALWHLHPTEDLAASKEVDAFWHELVLDTRRYRLFCMEAFGVFVDHIPDEAGLGMGAQYEATLARYRHHFGTPDPAFWSGAGASMPSRRR
jgi:hypothetical protein